MSAKEVDVGVATDVSTLSRLPKVMGSYTRVKNVCLTARAFDVEEALHVGFVSSVFPSKEEAITSNLRTAGLLATKSPVAVQGAKRFLDWLKTHDIATGT